MCYCFQTDYKGWQTKLNKNQKWGNRQNGWNWTITHRQSAVVVFPPPVYCASVNFEISISFSFFECGVHPAWTIIYHLWFFRIIKIICDYSWCPKKPCAKRWSDEMMDTPIHLHPLHPPQKLCLWVQHCQASSSIAMQCKMFSTSRERDEPRLQARYPPLIRSICTDFSTVSVDSSTCILQCPNGSNTDQDDAHPPTKWAKTDSKLFRIIQ